MRSCLTISWKHDSNEMEIDPTNKEGIFIFNEWYDVYSNIRLNKHILLN
jgi:hypothetical protein